MARRKQVAVQEDQTAVIEEAPPQVAETETTVLEAPVEQVPVRQWRDNPYPVKTVNLGGYKIVLQESRPAKEKREDSGKPSADDLWQMQIRFGHGGKEDMPSEDILGFIKSQKKTITTRDGEEKEVPLFYWNRRDQAWGMGIDYHAPRASRIRAEQVFDEIVSMAAREPGAGLQR